MEILVVNGSPSGKNSITLYTALYLEKLFPGQSFSYLNAAQTIHGLQKDFTPAIEALSKADLILFAYPVYTFIAPSQLHSFIRMMKESVQKGLLEIRGKTASQITTSKHFYDITAHNYVRDNCFDLGLNYIQGLSADMDDLLKTKGQKQASDWFRHLLWSMENGIFEKPIEHAETALITEVDVPESIDDPKKDKDI
ncbi:MAG: NAD(P)H-dependent oxidoreductase, partial [Spirochaetales bacterium]|nr:NAD(P)H-dependent oxidoreductase [Spirochaetales bacterium]